MNLKERQNKEKKKPENSNSTTQTSNQQSPEQILLSKVLELSDALNEEKQRALSQAQTRIHMSSVPFANVMPPSTSSSGAMS